jgi:NADPH:quinone reductase-like Zn-dependent oxidoreductase
VAAVGEDVADFKIGDEVYGFGHGAFADFVAVPHGRLARKPSNLSFEEAAAVPLAALTALQGLRDVAQVQPGQKVLIIGASGGVGTFAVQIAQALGAEVTGVCSTRNVELVRSLGAVRAIDYTTTDFTRDDERFDVAFQLGGTASGRAIRRVLTPSGTLVMSAGDGNRWIGPIATMLTSKLTGAFASQSVRILATDEHTADLDHVRDLIEAGTLRPVIERVYPLEEAGEAVRLVEEGSPGGKIVVAVQPSEA